MRTNLSTFHFLSASWGQFGCKRQDPVLSLRDRGHPAPESRAAALAVTDGAGLRGCGSCVVPPSDKGLYLPPPLPLPCASPSLLKETGFCPDSKEGEKIIITSLKKRGKGSPRF